MAAENPDSTWGVYRSEKKSLGSGVGLIVIVAIVQVWSSTEDTIDGEAILGSEGWAGTRGSC